MGKKVRTKHGCGRTMLLERKKGGKFKEWSNLPKKKEKTKNKQKKKQKTRTRTKQGALPKHTANKTVPGLKRASGPI